MSMIAKAIGLFGFLIIISMCAGICNTGSKVKPAPSYSVYEPNKPNEAIIVKGNDNELSELCKDWIYNRNKAYKLGKEGDTQGAAKAGNAMRLFMKDLEKKYTEKEITETIAHLEREGYTP